MGQLINEMAGGLRQDENESRDSGRQLGESFARG